MKISKKLAAIGAGLALAIGGTTYAVAAIPDSTSGEITGCYSNGSGQVRIIDKQASASCHSYETEVSWPSSTTAGITGYQRVTDTLTLSPNERDDITVTCPTGKKVTGGGFKAVNVQFGNAPDDIWATESYPSADNAWTLTLKDRESGYDYTITAYAICVNG